MMKLITMIGLAIMNIIYFIFFRFFLLMQDSKEPVPVPAPLIDSAILTQSAVTLAKRIRRRKISCYQVVKTYIERIKQINFHINAVIYNRFEMALNEAQICDHLLSINKVNQPSSGKMRLFGVPFIVKVDCALKDCRHIGCKHTLAKRRRETLNSAVVKSFREAGAILLCITNATELCSGIDSSNLLYTCTRNPYDIKYTAGGFSSGEASLLGAAGSLIGISLDFCGSLGISAYMNGVFGYKPTPGLVPNEFLESVDINLQKYLTLGPLVRYAEDLRLLSRVLALRCENCIKLDKLIFVNNIKVYYQQNTNCNLMSVAPEIEQTILNAVHYLQIKGVFTEKLSMDLPSRTFDIIMMSLMNLKCLLTTEDKNPKRQKNPLVEIMKVVLCESEYTLSMLFIATILQECFPISELEMLHHQMQTEMIRRELINQLGQNSVLLYPTFRIPATFPEIIAWELEISSVYFALANVLGFPAVHVPMGLNNDGLPIGIQVIAAPYQDDLCLIVAETLESGFGGWTPPTNIDDDDWS